jgi:hypothetical protein
MLMISYNALKNPPSAPRNDGYLPDETDILHEHAISDGPTYSARRPSSTPLQSINQRAPADTETTEQTETGRPVTRIPVCGGLINEYHQAA